VSFPRPTVPTVSRARAFALAGVLLVLAALPAGADKFRDGEKAFAATNYAAAREAFLAATNGAPENEYAARYNAAISALAAGDSASARAELDELGRAQALDVALRAREAYNRGLALAQESEKPENAQGQQEMLSRAVGEFKNALKLDPAYDDARTNYELSRRRLEELKAQQQQQQQQDQEQKQDEQEQQDQQQQPQNQEGQQENQSQEENQSGEENQEEQQSGQEQPQQSQDAQAGESGDEEQAQPQDGEEEMTREEAERLMDAMKEQEETGRARLFRRYGPPQPVERDW